MADVVENTNVRVIQAGNGARLAFEPLAAFRLIGEMSGKNLDGDDPVQAGVAGAINLPHSPCAGRRDDFVRAETCVLHDAHHFVPVGTRRFNSSNQFCTTLICVAACSCSLAFTIRNRCPSAETS